MKKTDKKNFYKKTVPLFIYLLATLAFTFFIHHLNILPLKYELIVIIPLYLLFFLFAAVLLSFRKKAVSVFCNLICTILSICLILCSIYIQKGQKTLTTISNANKKTYTMSLLVLDNSSYQSVSDLSQKNIELITKSDADNQNQAMDALLQINQDIHFHIIDEYKEMVDNLYNGKTDAVLINEAYRSMLEVEDDSFSDKTRVIWNYEITSDAINVRKEVDVVHTPFVIYISGIDTYGPISTVSRTDVNMLVTVNPNTKEILLTSIPRDAWVELDNMKAYDKLTHSGIAGVENSISTIENFMGVKINYYARVNFSSLLTIVDALGGIDIYNKIAFTSYHTHDYYPVGTIHMDGKLALEYARERHAYDFMFSDREQGDQMRVENQQLVLEGIINKMISPSIISHYSDVLDAVQGMFETNMTTSEITSLISMQLSDMSSWKFINMKISGTYEYQYGGAYMPDWHLVYYITDPDSVQQCKESIEKVLNNEPLS